MRRGADKRDDEGLSAIQKRRSRSSSGCEPHPAVEPEREFTAGKLNMGERSSTWLEALMGVLVVIDRSLHPAAFHIEAGRAGGGVHRRTATELQDGKACALPAALNLNSLACLSRAGPASNLTAEQNVRYGVRTCR